MLVHFKSKLSKVIGEDGPVGSGVGVGFGVGVGVAIGLGEGAGVTFAITFLCHKSLLPTFLQIKVPDVEFTFVHLAPTLGVAA
jgi:hypothetical protein